MILFVHNSIPSFSFAKSTRRFILPIAACLGILGAYSIHAEPPAQMIPALIAGDEAVVVTHHQIKTRNGILSYEARAGRLAIRNDESNTVLGYAFFVAYLRDGERSVTRPLLFAWNGGPGSDSLLVHTGLFGPRRTDNDRLVDNPETVIESADLVIYDAMGTGFSRLSTPANAKDFYSITADFAATAEFIRGYRDRFNARNQPLILAGESLGTWRAVGVAELLARKGLPVAGLILISGGLVGVPKSFPFEDAMFIPARTETAFSLHKLTPDLMENLDSTRRQAADWAEHVYWPALENIHKLSAERRQVVAHQLAHYTGVNTSRINSSTLIMTNTQFSKELVGGGKILDSHDMRLVGEYQRPPGQVQAIQNYLREELGYSVDLSYVASLNSLESGFMPLPSGNRSGPNAGWSWNHAKLTPEMAKRMDEDGAPPPGAQPWMERSMQLDPQLKVFITAGRTDPQVSCTGNAILLARLPPGMAQRFTNRCYEGGHMTYRVEASRIQMSTDIKEFITHALSH